MDLNEWYTIWWYRDMRYLGISCIYRLSTGPPGFGVSHIVYKVIILNVQGKCKNYTRGVQAYISYKI